MFSTEERIFALNNASIDYMEFRTLWQQRFHTACPNRRYRKRLAEKFYRSGSVHDMPRSGRPRSARTMDNIIHTATAFSEDMSIEIDISSERITTGIVADQIGISKQSVRNILRFDLKWKNKKATTVHMLTPYDIFRRAMFCRAMRRKLAVYPDYLDTVIWTDEAFFTLNGTMRTTFLRYWGDKDMQKKYSRRRETAGVMISVGLWRFGILGPYFFNELPRLKPAGQKEKIDSKKYCQLLKLCYLPEIRRQFPQDVQHDVIFQLDGAPIHTAKITKYQLNLHFPNRWMGDKGPVHFPPYSPDLTPLDFSFWGVLRTRVLQHRPATVPQLTQVIKQECEAMTPEYIEKICTSEMYKRIDLICENNGNHIEHLG